MNIDYEPKREYTANSAVSGKEVKPNKSVDDGATNWKYIALHLFKLLGNIDTASDIFKPEKTPYREEVRKQTRARFHYCKTDGYKITPIQFGTPSK